MNYVKVPYSAIQKGMRRRELERQRHARNRWKWNDTRRSHHEDKRPVGWDGEGPRDAGYALFGNSDGDEICHPFLRSREILDLLLAHKRDNPNTIDVWFGGDYDVSMLLSDLPRRNMSALRVYGRTTWEEYRIEHVPHKWFTVRSGDITVTLYDIHSFFDSGYANALDSWEVGTYAERAAIKLGKDGRADFLWSEIENIKAYFRLELRLMPPLFERLRTAFSDAGYVPRSWHGPGAMARMALRRHKIYDAMAATPDAVSAAARVAFAGGRFELKLAGHFKQRIWNYDIRSAYPYFATLLPNLARGAWRRTERYEPGKFGIYRIWYQAAEPDAFRLYPLFRRMPHGGVAWPYRVHGWYWNPETELIKDDPDATIEYGWVFDEDDPADRPFAWLAEYYLKRQKLKDLGQAAEYTFKLIINSVYGQLAQRVGWDKKERKAPPTHQLEWAGWITSACRATIYIAAMKAGRHVISIDTDGLYCTAPIEELQIGRNLGEWECKVYHEGIFWQSGVYCLREDLGYDESLGYGWAKGRARGIPRGTYTPEDLISRVKTRIPLALRKNKFIGYRQADNGQWENRNQWIDERPELIFGGTGKRSHLGRFGGCNDQCRGDVHALGAMQILYGPEGDAESVPHYLPWLDNSEQMTDAKENGYFIYSEEDPDNEVMGWTITEPTNQPGLRLRRAHAAGHSTILHERRVSESSYQMEKDSEYAGTA